MPHSATEQGDTALGSGIPCNSLGSEGSEIQHAKKARAFSTTPLQHRKGFRWKSTADTLSVQATNLEIKAKLMGGNESDEDPQEYMPLSGRLARRCLESCADWHAARAQRLVQLGELSSGRHALEGAELAPGNTATLEELKKRPARPRVPILPLPVDCPVFNLEERVFCRNVRSARKGAAGGLRA